MNDADKNREATERALTTILSQNRPYFGGRPDYGVRLKSVSANRHELEVELTFKRGIQYCCIEIGCHLGLTNRSDWDRLHNAFRRSGADVATPVTLHIVTVVEPESLIAIEPHTKADGTRLACFRPTPPERAGRFHHEFFETDCE